MNYYVRGGDNSFAAMPALSQGSYGDTQYGAIVAGNTHTTYGPWVDPEKGRRYMKRSKINRRKHHRRTAEYPFIT